jgi:hypothetical protein
LRHAARGASIDSLAPERGRQVGQVSESHPDVLVSSFIFSREIALEALSRSEAALRQVHPADEHPSAEHWQHSHKDALIAIVLSGHLHGSDSVD